ncbi:MAG: erythromycin esterase family protein [Candidatus Riflebacteria bacterium]|nr:erythromycin esterase family protein [Candidatus Riflebacteria bacterium]
MTGLPVAPSPPGQGLAGWALPLALAFLLAGAALPLGACDDTLMTLLTASDPKSEFSRGIRQFNRDLTGLGTALKERRDTEVEGLLGKVMESWLQLSNRFSISPPDEARGDPGWAAKMQDTATRIGSIRKAIQAGETFQAHNEVLALSNHLGNFFDSVKMSESYRLFLRMSDLFFQLEQLSPAGDPQAMRPVVASLTGFLRDLEPRLASEARPPYRAAVATLDALDATLASQTTSQAVRAGLIQNAKDDYLSLRSRILMMEWFPAVQPPGGSR